MEAGLGYPPQVEDQRADALGFEPRRDLAELLGRASGDVIDPQVADRVGAVETEDPAPIGPLADARDGRPRHPPPGHRQPADLARRLVAEPDHDLGPLQPPEPI